MQKNKISSVIFDLDGTLLDTTEEIHYIFNKVLSINNLPVRSKQFYKENIGKGINHLLSQVIPRNFTGDYQLILEQAKEFYSQDLNKKATVFSGIYDILDLLIENDIKIGIVTNKIHHLALRCVELFFKNYNIETIGAEHRYPRKPVPDSALFLAKQFKHPTSDIIFVGDSQVDIQTAQNAGMTSVGVLWGNGTFSELENSGADVIFKNTKDLYKYILNQI